MRAVLSFLVLCLAALPAGGGIERGARGYGLSVFEGNEITRFPCIYLGRLPNALAGQDLHVIRLEGPPFDEAGVIAGMSGSPIFFDGELLGALAYASTFSKEPIAFVTPIEAMRAAGAGDLLGGERASLPAGIAPIATPIWASGLPVEESAIRKIFGAHALLVPAGGVATDGAESPPARSLEDGAALGVALVRGDLNLTAIGTVTFVEGDTVYGFGHPLLGRGAVELPMTAAEILTVLPSYAISVKIGRAGPVVGTLSRDLLPAIVGTTGSPPGMIPMTVEARAPTGERRFSFALARDEIYSAPLASLVATSALSAIAGSVGRGTAEVEVVVAAEGRTYRWSDRGLFRFSPVEAAVLPPLDALWQNPWRRIMPDSVSIRIVLEDDQTYYRLRRVALPAEPVEPGETVPIRLFFETNEGEAVVREVSFRVPENLREGTYRLYVGPGRGWWNPAAPSPDDLESYLERLNEYERRDRIVVALGTEAYGGEVSGEALPALPPSARRFHGSSLAEEVVERYPFGEVFVGASYERLRVAAKGAR